MSVAEAINASKLHGASTDKEWGKVRVRSITSLADGICAYELIAPGSQALPRFSAGSHVDVRLPSGTIRQYSLCNPSSETGRYVIAVLRDENGRGGSIELHDRVRAGDELCISRPRNHFALCDAASEHILVAGGIGITPIMAMLHELQAKQQPFQLYYCTRSPERTAFLEDLEPLVAAGKAVVHHDGGDPSRGLNFSALFHQYRLGQHLYYCGPSGMMDAVEAALVQWPATAVHCERFSGNGIVQTPQSDKPFKVRLARSGVEYTVAPGESIVEVLRRHGIEIDVSCEEGYCGTCMTRYLEGEPSHRDTVLDDSDRRTFVMVCCARASSDYLVLDL